MIRKLTTLLTIAALSSSLALYAEDKKPTKDCPCADGATGKGMGMGMHPMDKNNPRFKGMDTDKNGEISKDEWMAKFTEMDADKNGVISEQEMKNHHEKMMNMMHEHMKEHKM